MDPAAKTLNKEIGRRLRDTRLERGLSQTRVGDLLGVTFQQVQKYEKGENTLSAAWIKNYAEILGVTINYILGDDPRELPQTAAPTYKHVRLGHALDKIERRNPKAYRALSNLIRQLAEAAGECHDEQA